MKAEHAIQTLWEYAAEPLPDEVLAHLAGAEDPANALRNLACLMEGVGCALANNAEPPAVLPDLPGIFLGLGSAVALQAELVAVASDAAAVLRHRGSGGRLNS